MLLQCYSDAWSLRIGDPHLLGWITAVCYLFAAVLTFLIVKRVDDFYTEAGKSRAFWLGLTVLLVFLGLNKQLDLQTYLSAMVKCHAILSGWYEHRQEFKLIFVMVIAAVFLMLLIFILSFFGENLSKDKFAIAGIVFLLGFILIHASYFYYFDMPVINKFYETGLNWVLEFIGIFFINLQSLLRLKRL